MKNEQNKISFDDKIINWISKRIVLVFLVFIIIVIVIPNLFARLSIYPFIKPDGNGLAPNEIGDAIGGMTAPIIGLFSAFLVYIAFREQIKANDNYEKNQLYDKEIEFIKNRISYIEAYIDNYEFHYIFNEQVVIIKGIAALYYQYGVRISYILNSFLTLVLLINNSTILNKSENKNIKEKYKDVIFYYWNDILARPIEKLIENHKSYKSMGIYIEINDFYNKIDDSILKK